MYTSTKLCCVLQSSVSGIDVVHTVLIVLYCSSKNKVCVNFYFACSELSFIIAVGHNKDLTFTSLLLDNVHYQELRTIHLCLSTRLCQAEMMIFQIVKSDSELPV